MSKKNVIKMRCYECKYCNKNVYFRSDEEYDVKCKTCKGEMIYRGEFNYNPNMGYQAVKSIEKRDNHSTEFSNDTKLIVECPYCGSTNTTKISATAKIINTAVWGIFGTKRHKQWHCNNCGSDF